jgi:hypothetical protein
MSVIKITTQLILLRSWAIRLFCLDGEFPWADLKRLRLRKYKRLVLSHTKLWIVGRRCVIGAITESIIQSSPRCPRCGRDHRYDAGRGTSRYIAQK